ncbi:MAG: coenzyme F420-0:L-glutamate ligase [Micromonosporaceae bacterium]
MTAATGPAGSARPTGPAGPGPTAGLSIWPVHGIGEVRPGDDLAGLIAGAAPWLAAGDVLVVTSKIVSKAEGRLVDVPPDPEEAERARQAAIDAESAREVARRGPTRIVQTRHGLVLASAGIDASNVESGRLVLLPVDPDASARRLRAELRKRLGIDVAVVVTDTMGRPWRLGLVDLAIGVSGLQPLRDHRGEIDRYGNPLQLTQHAIADELAAAGELVKGKLDGVPVAVVRGVDPKLLADDAPGASALVRPAEEDMFSLGTAEAVAAGRSDARLHADAVRTLTAWIPPDEHQAGVRDELLDYLAAEPGAMRRETVAGHLTASVLVVDATATRVLLALHGRIRRWVQLGGHCEPGDDTLAAAALREASEESGIAGLRLDPEPIDVDIHPVTCSLGVPTRHLDVRFVAVAPDGAAEQLSDESLDLGWYAPGALPSPLASGVERLIAPALARARG